MGDRSHALPLFLLLLHLESRIFDLVSSGERQRRRHPGFSPVPSFRRLPLCERPNGSLTRYNVVEPGDCLPAGRGLQTSAKAGGAFMDTQTQTGLTEQLRNEHEAIRVMLRVVDSMCHQLDRGTPVDVGDLDRVIEFFKVFSDRCHHAKEEEYLFVALEQAGVPREHGPIGVMLHDHEEGRRCIRGMAEGIAKYRAGEEGAEAAIVANGRAYVQLLSQHIEKENQVLFPLAERVLPRQKKQELLRQFDRLEEERIGHGRHEQFHRTLDELAGKYLRA